MALCRQFLSLFLLALLSSLHVHARDSQFFSKVTKKTVVEVPSKTQQSQSKTEQEPNFIPDTQNGYGLFGHESGQLPPSTTTGTTNPSGEPFTNTNSNTFNNKEAYVTNSQGMSDTKFMDQGYTTPTTTTSSSTTSNLPYRAESGEPFSSSNTNNYYNNEAYVTDSQGMNADKEFMNRGYTATTSGEPFTNSNYKNYYNNEAYVTGPQGMNADTKFTDRGYTTTTSGEPFTNSNPKNYYNNEAYVTGPQGMSDTRFMDQGYTTASTAATKVDNNYYYYNKDGTVIDPQGYTTTASSAAVNNNQYNEFATDPQGMSGRARTTSTNNQFSGPTKFLDAGYTTTSRNHPAGNNYYSNNQRQGMSDTRFMENGKYYYDTKSENNYNYANGFENSRGAEYNTQGYYGNNENSFDQYKNSNSMEGYQNQQEFQEEDPQEFEP